MRIYKYRDFSNPNEDSFRRLEGIIHRHLVWCAKVDDLNDPKEFIWECWQRPRRSPSVDGNFWRRTKSAISSYDGAWRER
jgi:hypothetical protein